MKISQTQNIVVKESLKTQLGILNFGSTKMKPGIVMNENGDEIFEKKNFQKFLKKSFKKFLNQIFTIFCKRISKKKIFCKISDEWSWV